MTIAAAPDTRISITRVTRTLRAIAVALLVLTGGIVYVEPSPYEFMAIFAILVCFGTGLRLHPRLWPLAFLLAAYIAFGIPATLQADPLSEGAMWMATSAFLVGTTLLYAAFIAEKPQAHFAVVGWAYVAAAAVPTVTAILGYFGVAGAELFLLYGRARGTFQDPNVLGPFLILPFLFLAEGALRGGLAGLMVRGALMLPMAFAILLTFSRGAWGHLVLSCALLAFFTFALSRSVRDRLRVLIVLAVGLMVLAGGLAAALSVPKVQTIFSERAQLTQQYDTGHEGRFGRWSQGFALAIEKPLGIGPLEFGKRFPEDPHNVYLNALMAFGWGGGLAYIVLVAVTVVAGFKAMFVPTPWQRQTIVAFSAFAPLALLGLIIDTDHWRHFFLLLGAMWGLIAATQGARMAEARRRDLHQRF